MKIGVFFFTVQVAVIATTVVLAAPQESKLIKQEASKKSPQEAKILKQINKLNDDGSYTYGYESDDGSFKYVAS